MSDEIVVDASAVVAAMADPSPTGTALAALLTETVCHAPHLIDAEVGHVLRRLVRGGQLTETAALTGLSGLDIVIDERYPHAGWLAAAAWELRHTVTFYDGLYVALAARLEVPLLTTDAKLTKAPGLPCKIEVLG